MSTTLQDLDGQMEGLARAFLHLVATLEDQGSIDGKQFSEQLRASPPRLPIPKYETAAQTMRELAAALDDARAYRRSRSSPA